MGMDWQKVEAGSGREVGEYSTPAQGHTENAMCWEDGLCQIYTIVECMLAFRSQALGNEVQSGLNNTTRATLNFSK